MACKRCKIQMYIDNNDIELFIVTEKRLGAHGDETKPVKKESSGFDMKLFQRQS